MKKIILLATCAASISAYALPTYEPFTEYSSLVTANSTNAIDLCALPAGNPGTQSLANQIPASADTWSLLNYSADSGISGTQSAGLDILVTNLANSPFTYATLTSAPISLPAGFPGLPASGQAITIVCVNPAQHTTGQILGNSAVLKFASDFTRPVSGSSQLFVSYLISFGRVGQLGTGNDGRFMSFLASTNLSEGTGTGGFYTTWASLFNTFNTIGPKYCGFGLLESTAILTYFGACDNSTGKDMPATGGNSSPFTVAMSAAGVNTPATPVFVVAAYTFNAGGTDVQNVWVNPSSLGGPTPPASPIDTQTLAFNMSDLGGLCLEDRPGNGATGGVPTNWIANLMIGTNWSFVTGGPEFTSQPVNSVVAPTSTTSLSATAVAAGQSVNYQWQKIVSGSPVNVSPGGAAGGNGAGGSATVSGYNTPTLTLTGVSFGDAGTYQLLATAAGTSFPLTSSTATVTVSDPAMVTQPQNATGNYGQSVTFTAQVLTATSSLEWAWYNGSTMLVAPNGSSTGNGGSTVNGAQGTNSGLTGTSTVTMTMTLNNVSCADDGSYTLVATNANNLTVSSTPATLAVTDPYIATQPPAIAEVSSVQNAVIPVTASGTGVSYQWFWQNVNGVNANPNGEISGANTSALTISSALATPADAGTYYVVVSGTGCAAATPATSGNTIVYYDTSITGVTASPATLTQQVGTHLAFVSTTTGGTGGLINYQWQFNNGSGNVNLANGTQADGSWISGATATTMGAGSSALVVSNLHVADTGTYTLMTYNAAGNSSAAPVTLTVSAGLLGLSTANLEVTRVGEGSQTLSGATGNTLYLDQFTTSGGYVSTIMVPDKGGSTLIVPGAGADGYNESYLTLSSNSDYLNFIGYFQTYPSAQATVNAGGALNPRAIGAVNGLGYFVEAYTNEGIDSGGGAYVRAAFSTDGLINFWIAGAAGSAAVKYVNAGPAGASYANGSGVPALSTAVSGPIMVGLLGPNLIYTANSTAGDGSVTPAILGLNEFSGAPESAPDPTTQIMTQPPPPGISHPDDFAFSPDGMTVYVADDDVTSGATGNGGIQRWDFEGGAWTYNYNLYDTSSPSQTNGMRGLTVNWSANATWGYGTTGAIIYATTSEVVGNRLIAITDNGFGSASTVLDTAGPNQFYRGVRFGPATVAPAFVTGLPATVNTYVGQNDTLTVTVTGDAPFSYVWTFNNGVSTTTLSDQTNSLVFNNLQANQSGTYTVTVTSPAGTTSSSTVVSVTSGPATLVAGPQSLVETVGDHLAFNVSVTGTTPIFYQWASNGVTITGATTSSFSLANITQLNSGTYTVTYWNQFNTMPYPTTSANLTVTTSLQPLSANNLVVARVGDGVQALSIATGNTLYLDQLTTSGGYVNTIMIPDNLASKNLVVAGGTPEGPIGSVLTLSSNTTFLNFAGFDAAYPATSLASPTLRSIYAVNAFGVYEQVQDNQTIYNPAGDETFNCAQSQDGYAEFWTSGNASSPPAIKYAPASAAGPAGGNIGLAGSSTGTRVVNMIHGNIVYSDVGAFPPGIWAFSGAPTAPVAATSIISDAAGNPNDFAASPDTTSIPPSTSTVYVCDASTIAGGGGIQRYDWNGSAYALSYTLGTGTGSTVGASCLTVDWSANATWGTGVKGAIIYATTAAASSNQLIKIIDTGSGSTATVLDQANASELLRGVRFSPVAAGPILVSQPAPQTAYVGGTAVFLISGAQNGPITGYQWQFNGQNIMNGNTALGTVTGAQTTSLTIANVQPDDDQGSFTVLVSNPNPTPTASKPALLTVPVKIITPPAAFQNVNPGGTAYLTVTATGGTPTGTPLTYQWFSPCGGPLMDGQTDPCGSGATITGSSTSALTIAGVTGADTGNYYVTVSSANATSANTSATPSYVYAGGGPPAIYVDIQPTALVVPVGYNAVFSAEVTGATPLSYQWTYNGGNLMDNGHIIGSQTSSSLTIANCQLSDTGTYQLVVNNGQPPAAMTSQATLTVTLIGFNDGADWTANGNGSISGGSGNYCLSLTQGGTSQTSSAFLDEPVDVDAFIASWNYTATPAATAADGMAFVLQNAAAGTAALGGGGNKLGYVGIAGDSIAFEFNIFAANGVGLGLGTNGFGKDGTTATGGGPYSPTGPVNIASGDAINVMLQYGSGVATMTLSDATANTSYTTSYNVNIPTFVGSDSAYVGFTGSAGGTASTQNVCCFLFTSVPALTIQNPGNGNLIISWPVEAPGFTLEQTPSLVSPISWTPVNAVQVVSGGQNQVTIPVPGTPQYYRLTMTTTPCP